MMSLNTRIKTWRSKTSGHPMHISTIELKRSVCFWKLIEIWNKMQFHFFNFLELLNSAFFWLKSKMTRIYLQRKFPTLRDHIIKKTYQNLSKLSQKNFHCFYLKIKNEILISYIIQQVFRKHIQFCKHIFYCVMSLYLNSGIRYFFSSSICTFVHLAT